MSAYDVVWELRKLEAQPFAVEVEQSVVSEDYDESMFDVKFMAETDPISVVMWGEVFIDDIPADEIDGDVPSNVDRVEYVSEFIPGGVDHFRVYLRTETVSRAFTLQKRAILYDGDGGHTEHLVEKIEGYVR